MPARTTSFTVPPNASRTRFTSSSGTVTPRKRRWRPTGWLMLSWGATSRPSASVASDRPSSPSCSSTRRGTWIASVSARCTRATSATPSLSVSSSSCSGVGAGSGSHAGASGMVGSGVKSNRTVATSTPEMPSTSAWCVFWITATLPPSSPSTNQSSHSGRSRSSCCVCTRSNSARSCARVPGSGAR